MKKYVSILIILCLIGLISTGCSKTEGSPNDGNKPDVQESAAANGGAGGENSKPQEKPTTSGAVDVDLTVLNLQESAAANGGTGGENSKSQEKPTTSGTVDVDLTVLSSTMIYAEVYNMMTKPDDYMGKTIKMSGPYYASYYDQTDQYYHYVIIEDATACCQQGLEFVWNGDHAYPDDYPKDQARIEVVGVFGRYDELGQTYYYLDVDDVSFK